MHMLITCSAVQSIYVCKVVILAVKAKLGGEHLLCMR